MRVIANYGAMYPTIEGMVTSFINGIATFYDINNPEEEYTVPVSQIRIWGERTTNGSLIGVYFHPEMTEMLTSSD
jgi:hypothetical protein